MTPEALVAWGWYCDFKNFGMLPFGSVTLAGEPGVVYDAFRIFDDEVNSVQREDMSKRQSEVERQVKRGSAG